MECPVCFDTFCVLPRFKCKHPICYTCGLKLRITRPSHYYLQEEGGYKCPLCRGISKELIPPTFTECRPFLDREESTLVPILRCDRDLLQEAIDYLLRRIQRDLPFKKKMFLVDLCRHKGVGAMTACMIAHDYNGEVTIRLDNDLVPVSIRYEPVDMAVRFHLENPQYNLLVDLPIMTSITHLAISPHFISEAPFFELISTIARGNIQTLVKSEKPRKIKNRREEILLPCVMAKTNLRYYGLDLIASTVELIGVSAEVKMNAIQWCVYSRHFINDEPLLNLCAELPIKATLVAMISLSTILSGDITDADRGTDYTLWFHQCWNAYRLPEIEKKCGLDINLIESSKYLALMVKTSEVLDIAVAHKRWPYGGLSYLKPPVGTSFSVIMEYVINNPCFRVVREGYNLRYV